MHQGGGTVPRWALAEPEIRLVKGSNIHNTLFALAAAATLLLLGGCGNGEGAGGGGGEGGSVLPGGTCSDPVDFDANFKEMGRIPFIEGDREGAEAEHVGSCGGLGAEVVIAWTAKRHGVVNIGPIGPSPGLILYARRDCEDALSELSCSRERRLPPLEVEEGETLYVFADTNGGVPHFELAFDFTALLDEGDTCVPPQTAGLCKAGLLCKDPGVCGPNIPPIVTDALAHERELEDGSKRIKLRAYGEAPDRNTTHVVYIFLDEEGEQVGRPARSNIQMIQKEPVFWVGHTVGRKDYPGAVTVRFQFQDAFGGESNILERTIAPPPVRGEGDECDPDIYFGICDEGLFCEAEESDPPTCESLATEDEDLP